MTQIQIFLLILILLSIIILTLIVFRLYWKVRLDSFKYKLFAVRDDLIWLIAQKKLSKDDFLFKELYPMVNALIKNIKEIKLESLINITESQLNRVKSDTTFGDKFLEELRQAPEEVRQVAFELLTSLALILIHNSTLLFIAIVLHLTSIVYFKKMVRLVRNIFPIDYKAYRQYNEIENLKLRLHHA